MSAQPSAFLAGLCPHCGEELEGIEATGPGQHRAQPCNHPIHQEVSH